VKCFASDKPESITKISQIENYKKAGAELKKLITTSVSNKEANAKKRAAAAALTKKYKEEAKSLGNLSVAQLKDILRANNQRLNGNKDDLLVRIGEGMTNGALPKCSECGGGNLHFTNTYDKVFCKGFMDDEDFVKCSFSAKIEDVKRSPWIKEVPKTESASESEPATEPPKEAA